MRSPFFFGLCQFLCHHPVHSIQNLNPCAKAFRVMVGVSHYHCDAFPPPKFLYGINVDPRLNHHDHVVNHRKERLTLNRREQKRLLVMNEIEKKVMKGRETAEVLGLSEREGGGYWQLIGRRELRGLPMGIEEERPFMVWERRFASGLWSVNDRLN